MNDIYDNDQYYNSFYKLQRKLSHELLDKKSIQLSAYRDLAAYILINLHDEKKCWNLFFDCIIKSLLVDRVDGGWCSVNDTLYTVGQFELKRDSGIPSVGNFELNNKHPTLRSIWESSKPLVHNNLENDCIFDKKLRNHFLNQGIFSKMTASITYNNQSIGLICIDQCIRSNEWKSWQYDYFFQLLNQVISPIFYEILNLKLESNIKKIDFEFLTPAEKIVCELAIKGLSYKEISNRLDKSFSTVDHHLRNARKKMGVSSTSKLISKLVSKTNSEIIN